MPPLQAVLAQAEALNVDKTLLKGFRDCEKGIISAKIHEEEIICIVWRMLTTIECI